MDLKRLQAIDRRRRPTAELLEELADGASSLAVEVRPRVLGIFGSILGYLGVVSSGAFALRRALDLANVPDDRAEYTALLRRHDLLRQHPHRTPAPEERSAALRMLTRVLRNIDLPVMPEPTAVWLEELDERRFHDPRGALAELLPAVDRLPKSLSLHYLAVLGTVYRFRAGQRAEIQNDLRRAEEVLTVGLRLARRRSDAAAEARFLQRLAYVVADCGRHRRSLALAEQAGGIWDRLGEDTERGKALLDQALWLWHLGDRRQSLKVTQASLPLLANAPPRSLASALHTMGFCYQQLGDPRTALDYAERAADYVSALDSHAEAKLLWLRSSLHVDLGEFDEAARVQRKAVELFYPIHHGEAALATTDLVRILILSGRPDEAYDTAMTMRQLVIPLHGNTLVSSAIAELLRGSRAALNLARIDSLRSALENAKTDRSWQRLRVMTHDQSSILARRS